MGRFETNTILLIGIGLIVIGIILRSPITDAIVDLIGVLSILAGIAILIMGIVSYVRSKTRP